MNIQEIKTELKNRYDYISKYDALKHILEINPQTKIKDILSSWEDLYQD